MLTKRIIACLDVDAGRPPQQAKDGLAGDPGAAPPKTFAYSSA